MCIYRFAAFLLRTSRINRASLWQWLPRKGCRFMYTPSIFAGHSTKQCYEYLIHDNLQKNIYITFCPASFVHFVLNIEELTGLKFCE